MESYSPSTSGVRIKRELIDEYDEPLPNRKSLKTNQGDVKGISHVDDNDIVKCHYKDVKKENVDVKPDVHMKSEKKFEVNTERNFRTLRNRKINLTAQAPLKNVNIKKEKIIEENVQNNSGDIQRASHNDDKEIAELIECHDVKHKLVNVKEEPKVRLETEKIIQVNAKFNLIQEAAQEFLEIKIERNVVNKKVIVGAQGITKNSIIKNYICACEKKFESKSVLKVHSDDNYKHMFNCRIRMSWQEKKTGASQFIDLKAL
ncbi:hypothetical protein TKK_0007054 [Trichogramma kaykai]